MKKNEWQEMMDTYIGDVIDSLHTKYREEDGIDAAITAVETARDYKQFTERPERLDSFISYLDGICDCERECNNEFALECAKWIRMYAIALTFAGYR